MAGEMVAYGITSLKRGHKHDDAIRTLEHGLTMLEAGASRGPVALALARLHADSGRPDKAVDVLQECATEDGQSARVQVAAREALALLCLSEGQAALASQQAHAAIEACERGEGPEEQRALTVQAYSATVLIFHACGDLGSAAETAGEAMSAWDQSAPQPSPARDSQVAAALKGAASTLHATLPLAEEDTFKALGWAYMRAANAAAATDDKVQQDPVAALNALWVEPDALLGYAQVLVERRQFKEAEDTLTTVLQLVEPAEGG
eukprot:CAMPEP_0118922304 /NCGR_PEP_ID=MMETSP1169-20130426/1277_1 /TAXON_ID=36882 /ORGANISM="Pyramimonas obovata, Strain CCMP722" /LENGTH=262 /DNA_ID=CAMNT_0006863149 /DNA_START=198 /DNA_END=982 /DNA_ORIENTATION=+